MWSPLGFVLLSGLVSRATAASTTAASLCTQLKRDLLLDEVLEQSDHSYADFSKHNWAATAWNTPACITTPSTTRSLQSIVKSLVQNKVPFAIRGGGHAVAPNAGNIGSDGVLIDMSGFDDVIYDAEQSVVVVGSGRRWGHVYEVLTPLNMTAVGGRLLDVGVAGSTLGGGLSYITDKYGTICDNVVNFELVLGDGRLTNANATSNQDLFRALKGGGNNFGIITRFTYKAYAQGLVWAGIRYYAHEQLPALVSAMAKYQADPNKDPEANLMIQATVTDYSQIGAVLNFIYGQPDSNPSAFALFADIPFTADTMSIRTLEDFMASQIVSNPVDGSPRWDFRTTSFIASESVYSQVLDLIFSAPELENVTNVPLGTMNMGWQPISPEVARQGEAKGGNSLGLASLPQVWLALDTGWGNSSDDATVYDAPRKILERVEILTKKEGKYLDYQFLNDASYDQQVLKHYGKNNERRFKAVSRKYDPEGVFQTLVRGGWKIPL